MSFLEWSPDGKAILFGTFGAPAPPATRSRSSSTRPGAPDGDERPLPRVHGRRRVAAGRPGGVQLAVADQPAHRPDGVRPGEWSAARVACPTATVSCSGSCRPDSTHARSSRASSSTRAASGRTCTSRREAACSQPGLPSAGISGSRGSPRPSYSAVPLAVDGTRLLAIRTAHTEPANLVVIDTRTGAAEAVTELNAGWLTEMPFDVHHLTYPTSDGETEIEGWYLAPRQSAAPYPTVLHIHGGPFAAHGEIFNLDNLLLTAAGYGVLSVNFRGGSGYGDAHARDAHRRLGPFRHGRPPAGGGRGRRNGASPTVIGWLPSGCPAAATSRPGS